MCKAQIAKEVYSQLLDTSQDHNDLSTNSFIHTIIMCFRLIMIIIKV